MPTLKVETKKERPKKKHKKSSQKKYIQRNDQKKKQGESNSIFESDSLVSFKKTVHDCSFNASYEANKKKGKKKLET
jgi:hypothetical protein